MNFRISPSGGRANQTIELDVIDILNWLVDGGLAWD